MNAELKSSPQITVQLAANDTDPIEPVFELERYGKLKRVLRVTAWIKRFIENALTKTKTRGELTADELFEAEKYWIKTTQNQSFSQEIKQLNAAKSLNNDCKIKELKPFLDEHELLSVGGRLQQSDFTFREQHPWIMPNKHRYSELLIQSCHEKVMHSGVRDTLVQVRERYWILRARQLVKSTVADCTICKRFRQKPDSRSLRPCPKTE